VPQAETGDKKSALSTLVQLNVKLPDVLDVFIAGAGPAGTAAAFRARELGMQVLVTDRDEVLSILRDFMSADGDRNKDKEIEHTYGAGGKAPFPVGDKLVRELVYEDKIRAGELYERWLKVYNEYRIPVRIKLDLEKLSRRSDGLWEAHCVGLTSGERTRFLARAVVLALGKGRPRSFEDVVGDIAGVSFKLRDFFPRCSGAPVCVVGGGVSGAEAVIAISNEKVKSGDQSYVYWSFRRRNPEFNRNLAEEFAEACIANGNIQLLPYSEAVAVVKLRDGRELFLVRTQEHESPGHAGQGAYLQFPKDRVLACIGSELPREFLEAQGIRLLSADDGEERMAASPIFESCLPSVFLAGALLAEDYIETSNFDPQADQPASVPYPNNFKPAMCGGVLAVEAIHQRSKGKSDDEIASHVARRRQEFAARYRPGQEPGPKPPPPPSVLARFVRVRDIVGKEDEIYQESYEFPPGRVRIGRSRGQLTFANDPKVIDDHAELVISMDSCYLSTEGTAGQAYVAVRSERTLNPGQVFRLGTGPHVFRVEYHPQGIALSALDPALGYKHPKRTFAIKEEWQVFRRRDIDEDDSHVSKQHFAVRAQGQTLRLADLGSRNGTFVQVPQEGVLRLQVGDLVEVGDQLLKFLGVGEPELAEKPAAVPPTEPLSSPPAAAASAAAAAAAAPGAAAKPVRPKPAAPAPEPAPAGPPQVRITNAGIAQALTLAPGEKVLVALERNGFATSEPQKIGGKVQCLYQCRDGTCKRCVVRVRRGGSSLGERNRREKGALFKAKIDEINEAYGLGLKEDECRLACLCASSGPVDVELLGNTEP
jgi:thioredoxin reductase/ferredoxin